MSATRRVASFSGLVALLILAFTIGGDAAGPWPHAVGGGTALDGTKFAFSALQGPSSTRGDFGSHGHASLSFTDGSKVSGPVLCASVNDTNADAAFVFQYTDSGGNSQQARVYVKDGGDPPAQDSIGWDNVGATCLVNSVDGTLYPANSLPAANTQAVTKGNIEVSTE